MPTKAPLRILFPTRFHIFDQLVTLSSLDVEIYSIYPTYYFRRGPYQALGAQNHTLWLGLALRGLMLLAAKMGLRGTPIRLLRSLYIAGCGLEFYLRTRNAPLGTIMSSAGYLGSLAEKLQRRGHKVVINHGSLYEADVRKRLRNLLGTTKREANNWSNPKLIARMNIEFETADLIIVCSPIALDGFPRMLHPKIVVVPLGVSETFAAASYDVSARLVENGTTFLHISNLSAGKNVANIIQAFLTIRGPDDRMIIGGPTPQDPALIERMTAPGVLWLGRLDRAGVAKTMAAADIFVHPSFADGWAMAVTEALAAGLPVVASPFVGSASYYAAMKGGGTSVLLPDPTDITAIAAAMAQLRQTLKEDPSFVPIVPMAWDESAVLLIQALAPLHQDVTQAKRGAV